jgi:site-specific DNA-methyltransferase (adenine-specific)
MQHPITNFYVSHDRRSEKTDITDLAVSIHAAGLLQPIICKKTDEGFEIVAGRRRFYAVRDILEWTELEEGKHFYTAEDSIDGMVIELEENSHRVDFTPLERAYLIKDIHDAGIAKEGRAVKGVKGGWGLEDTARVIGRNKGYVSRMLSIVENKELVGDCGSVDEALTRIKKTKEKEIAAALRQAQAEVVEIPVDIEAYTKNVIVDEASSFITMIEDESVDLILTDPPFAINYDDLIDAEYDAPYEDDPQVTRDMIEELIPHYYRVLKNDKYIIMFVGFDIKWYLKEVMQKAGFFVPATPLYWFKLGTGGKTMQPDIRPGNVMQEAILGWKGVPEITVKGVSNVFSYQTVRENRIHRAQMPEALTADLVQTFSYPGDLILDTFAGSLAVMRGCMLTERRFIGCEKYQENVQDAVTYTIEWFKKMSAAVS